MSKMLMTEEMGQTIVDAIKNTNTVKEAKEELDTYFTDLKDGLPDTYDEQNTKIEELTTDISELNNTLTDTQTDSANKVWGTDDEGVPCWRKQSDGDWITIADITAEESVKNFLIRTSDLREYEEILIKLDIPEKNQIWVYTIDTLGYRGNVILTSGWRKFATSETAASMYIKHMSKNTYFVCTEQNDGTIEEPSQNITSNLFYFKDADSEMVSIKVESRTENYFFGIGTHLIIKAR